MPRPVYIVCAESTSLDRATGLLSIFHVVEGYTVHRHKVGREPKVKGRIVGENFVMMKVVAAWAMEDADKDQPFEWQLAICGPSGAEHISAQGQFRFRRLLQKVQVGVRIEFRNNPTPGVGEIRVRVRRIGEDEWSSQSYPLSVTVADDEGGDEEGSAGDDPPESDHPPEPTKSE